MSSLYIQLTFSAAEREKGAAVPPPPHHPIPSSYLPADSRSNCSMTTFLRFFPCLPHGLEVGVGGVLIVGNLLSRYLTHLRHLVTERTFFFMYRRRVVYMKLLISKLFWREEPYRRGGGYRYVMLHSYLWGPKWHLLRSLPFQGPKKSRFQGPPLIMALVIDIARLKNLTYRAIKNKYIISYYLPLLRSRYSF